MCMSVLPSPLDNQSGSASYEALWPSLLEKAVSTALIILAVAHPLKVYEVDGRIRFSWIVSDLDYFCSRTYLTLSFI